MSGHLFDLDEIPEVPLFREPRGRRGPASGSMLDARFTNEYPPDWKHCQTCGGTGREMIQAHHPGCTGNCAEYGCPIPDEDVCAECLGMGSIKGRVRLEAGHRCVRCHHPFMTKSDARMLGVEPSPGHWSPCDLRCTHLGTVRLRDLNHADDEEAWVEYQLDSVGVTAGESLFDVGWGGVEVERFQVEAEWRVLTVHHLDGDKANCRWWNLASLCQRCHLKIQAKVVMERIYPHEHSAWFRPYVAGYYAFVYLDEDLTRPEVEARMGELLALEFAA